MTSVNIEKIVKYFKIKERVRSENLPSYYLCKGIFSYDFPYPETCYIKHKLKKTTEIAKTP